METQGTNSHDRTFPSILYSDYPSTYTFCGTLPTTTAGVATCLRYPCGHPPEDNSPFFSDSPVFAYPSHPPIPDSIQNISASELVSDPKGSTYDAVWSFDGGYAPLIKPLIDMAAWNCTDFGAWDAAASALRTALYLTATSTSTEAGAAAGATPAPEASPSKEIPAAAAVKEPEKAEPQTTKPSPIFANPFDVEKPSAVVETPTHTPSVPVAVVPAPSSDQAASDNKDSSNTPASNPAPEKANSNAGTQPNQAANGNIGSSSVPVATPPVPQEGSSNVGSNPNQVANGNAGSSSVPVANPPVPQEGSSNIASSPDQVVNVNQANSSPPAANSPSSQEASPKQASNEASTPNTANLPSSGEGNPNNEALLPIPGLNNQASTAVPVHAANAVASVVISSTNSQGSVVITTSQAPGIIVTSTNAQGSQVLTTVPVVSPEFLSNTPNPNPVVVNGHTLTTNSQSQYVIAGQTLSPNTPVILGSDASTTPVVLQTTGIHPVLVIGSSTTTLHLPSSTPAPTTPPAITVGTQAITANAQGQYIVGSQTLTPGGEIVVGGTTQPGGTAAVGGTTVSLAPSGTQAVVGTSTEGLAPYIAGGLGTAGPNGTTGTGVVQFKGGAGVRFRYWDSRYLVGIIVGITGIMWVV